MVNSRQKGAQGEREVAKELFEELGIEFKRDLRQYQSADYGDLVAQVDNFPFSIEVKRHKKGWTCRPEWEEQTQKSAQVTNQYPCVIYRFDGQQWRCRIWFSALAESYGATCTHDGKVDLSIHDFAWVAREIMSGRAL